MPQCRHSLINSKPLLHTTPRLLARCFLKPSILAGCCSTLARDARVVMLFVLELANRDARPRWTEGDEFDGPDPDA